MIFSKGDKVKFLNEVGGGEVVEIIDDNMVMVETLDGFRVPCLINELIRAGEIRIEIEDEALPDSPSQKMQEPGLQNLNIISKIEKEKNPDSDEVLLALVNQFMADGNVLNTYLINMSPYNILFHLGFYSGSGLETLAFDELETGEKILLGPLPEFSGDALFRIRYQIIFFKNEWFQPLEPLSGVISLDNEMLLNGNSFIENDFFDEKALFFPLVPAKKISLSTSVVHEQAMEKGDVKLPSPKKTKVPKSIGEEVEEVDLHANVIADHPGGLEPAEILEMQIARFEIALEGAIRNKQKKIIFIHGRGEGKLKHRIRKIMEEKYSGLRYQDASFKEYGYGATLVILR